jgi:hypothetical protein
MRSTAILTVAAATALWAATAFAGEKIKLPTGSPALAPHVTAAVDQGTATVQNVAFGRRMARRGYYGYTPYYSYRPYYGGYGYGYGGYYTRPYYGYSYYSPGWSYGPGWGYGGWGPGYGGLGVGPMARMGGWYW